MWPRFVGRLGPADVVTVANAVLGFVAILTAFVDVSLAARFVLLAAIGDGIDGVVARHVRSTPIGEHLDSLSDVVAFGAAPGVVVAMAIFDAWDLSMASLELRLGTTVVVSGLFVGMVVVRLALYTAHDVGNHHTKGAPSTLAATLIAAAILSNLVGPIGLLALASILTYLMVTTITYPDLLARDAFIMGTVHGMAVLFPAMLGGAFPRAIFILALAYLCLGPWFYWGPDEECAIR